VTLADLGYPVFPFDFFNLKDFKIIWFMQSFHFERHLVKVSPETRRAH
jgi:hypothetical protein